MTKARELAKMGEVLTNSQIGGRRNIAYNGAMQISQRGTQTGQGGAEAMSAVDRFKVFGGGSTARVDLHLHKTQMLQWVLLIH